MDVTDAIKELLKPYLARTHLRLGNGPDTECIPQGSPWGNPFEKSFNSQSTQCLQADLAGTYPVNTPSTAPISATSKP
jgi:hypothetical protein